MIELHITCISVSCYDYISDYSSIAFEGDLGLIEEV